MSTNVLFLKFVKTVGEDDEAFEKRIELYKSKVGKHNKSMHNSNHYFDSGFDIFQPKGEGEILGKRTYKVDLGIQTAMYNVNGLQQLIGRPLDQITDDDWQELIHFPMKTVENFTELCDSGQARPEPYVIHPRSSIYKKSFRLANSTGIIDTGYRGNLAAVIDNDDDFGKYSVEKRNVLVEGERYFQICRADLQRFYIQMVEVLPKTSRGDGGFGSTGN
jgi:hypothetical protein